VDHKLLLVSAVVLVAFGFDFINGFHDAANSIATVVSTRVLTPFQAVLWAAFFNFVAFGVFELHVAGTIGKGIIDPIVVVEPHHVVVGSTLEFLARAGGRSHWRRSMQGGAEHFGLGEYQHHGAIHLRLSHRGLYWLWTNGRRLLLDLAKREPRSGRSMVPTIAASIGRGV
jgi:Phosphate transporter family